MIEKKKNSLNKRYAVSYETKESNSVQNTSVMDYKKINREIAFYAPAEGRNRINIIPYVIKSNNHPMVKSGEFDIGEPDYVMDIFTHRSIGPSEKTCICLKNTYGKPCPICEQMQIFKKEGKDEEAKALKSSRRVFYNVEDLKEPGKIKVFETSHYLFEKELIDEARDEENGGGFINFADVEDGKEIKFRAGKKSIGEMEFLEFKSFSFEDREKPISDKLLKNAVSFDEIMIVPTYDELKDMLYGKDDDDNSDDEEKKPKKVNIKDDDDEEKSDDDEEKSDDDEEKSDDDEEKSDDDEEKKPKKSKKNKCSDECPYGHTFGKDVDKFEVCDDCEVWDKCIKNK